MWIGRASLTCGAFGQPGVPLSLSRRAHLLTTDKIGGVLPTADVRSARLCFGTSHRNGKFALAAQHRYFHLAMKNSKYCTLTIVTQERK